MPTATSATAIETRAPTMIIDSTSRPKWSVPNQCAAEGGLQLRRDVERGDVVGRPDEGDERREQRRPRRARRRAASVAHQRAPPQPRVDRGVGEVDQEGDER